MSAFQDAVAALPRQKGDRRAAPRTVELTPDRFADTWEGRPIEPIVVGLRVPAEADLQSARDNAAALVSDKKGLTEEGVVNAHNDALLSIAVARGICDPNDVTAAHPFFELADDIVPLALKSNTIRWLFDEIERLHVEQSPIFPEATPEEVLALSDLLATEDPFCRANPVDAMRARRYLRFALDLIDPVE